MNNSKKYSINWRDVLKGFALAVGGVLLPMIIAALQPGNEFNFTWVFWLPIIKASMSAGLTYILINFFTNSDNQLFKPEN